MLIDGTEGRGPITDAMKAESDKNGYVRRQKIKDGSTLNEHVCIHNKRVRIRMCICKIFLVVPISILMNVHVFAMY